MEKAATVVQPKQAAEDFLLFLVDRKAISRKDADRVRKMSLETHRPVVQVLSEAGVLSEEEAYRFRAEFLGIPFSNVGPDTVVAPELLHIIAEDAARRYQFVPLSREGSTLTVGMLVPENLTAQDALRFIARREGLHTQVTLITPTGFKAILQQYRPFQGEVSAALTELEEHLVEEKKAVPPESRRERRSELTEEAPVIKMVAVMLREGVEGNASDIHIEPGRKQMRVRFRVDGVLYTSLLLPMSVHPAVVSRVKILSNLKIDETRLAQDGRFRATIDERGIDFRVATLPTALGEKVAIRLLDPRMRLKELRDLGMRGKTLKETEEAITHPFGIVLITGPTGSGKSTTLYAILHQLNKETENIVTLEDPVEYYIEGINQSQINEEIGYTFASGLRHILRGDPNIIMVGEIRDADTAKLAVHAGLTGHLVFSTLHTNNAVGAIPRMIDLGVDTFLIPPTLLLVIAQRLVQKLCPDCKKSRELRPKEREFIEKALEHLPDEERETFPPKEQWQLWEAPGCVQCRGRGLKGRIAVFECLRMTRRLADIIISEPSEGLLADEAKRQGMVSMLQDGLRKVLDGTIALQELLRVVEEQEE